MKTTLITGASSGIGEVFAGRLAGSGHNLLLVARSEEKLVSLAAKLGQEHGISAQHVAADLTREEDIENLFAETEKRHLDVDLLINNAGFGSRGDFAKLDLERELRMITLNIGALVVLTHHYIQPMRAHGGGAIINVASTAAFQPVPYMATYAATKAFVLSFSEALWEENRAFGIKIMALCPGVTETNFFETANMRKPPVRNAATPESVVETALRGLEKNRSHIISGWTNYLMTGSERLFPRSTIARIAGKMMRPDSEGAS